MGVNGSKLQADPLAETGSKLSSGPL